VGGSNGHRHPGLAATRSHLSIVLARLARLFELEIELGLAEIREVARSVGVTAGVAGASVILLLAALIVLLAGLLAPVFGAEWKHLVLAAVLFLVLGLAGAGWSFSRFKRINWPEQTLRSLLETMGWLGTQLKSKLTLR
jgi:hypothetical protein